MLDQWSDQREQLSTARAAQLCRSSQGAAGQGTADQRLVLSSVPLDRRAAENLASLLRAIADPARLQVISLIQAGEDGEACVCELTGSLGLSQPTVSHHLKILLAAGLVTRERRGTWAYYRMVSRRLEELAELLHLAPTPSA
jgi:ArsR family transcriptional regulator